MNHSIYNLYLAITLRSETDIHLQSISLSHTYGGLLCSTPNEQINANIIAEIREEFEGACYVIKPKVTMLSEYDFFDKVDHYTKEKNVALLPAVKVTAIFECYGGEESTFLHIAWFQDDFSTAVPSCITDAIQDIDWYRHAIEFSL